jgi:enoyl-CoA hydratase/carnithine racemase
MTLIEAGAEPNVVIERHGNVMVLTLNRPEQRNAMNSALMSELNAALRSADKDEAIGAVILTGRGPAFCAGGDLKETSKNIEQADFWTRYDRATQSLDVHRLIAALTKPVIGAINGFALAGGAGLAMSCDLVVASDKASFGYPEVKRGLVAAMVMVSLSRIVGRRQALELLLSGRMIDAREALAIGMINRVVPHETLMQETLTFAGTIAANSHSSLRMTKKLFNDICEMDKDRAIEHARDIGQMIRQTKDARQGSAAFANRSATQEPQS